MMPADECIRREARVFGHTIDPSRETYAQLQSRLVGRRA